MIHYFLSHLVISTVLFIIWSAVSRFVRFSNIERRVILYAILIKSVFLWGIFSFHTIPVMDSANKQVIPLYSTMSGKNLIGASMHMVTLQLETLVMIAFITISAMIIFSYVVNLFRISQSLREVHPVSNTRTLMLFEELCKKAGLAGSVKLKVHGLYDSPFIMYSKGWTIILPLSFFELDKESQYNIFAHELAHIRRKDFYKYLILKLIASVFFFSPAIRRIYDEIVSSEEIATDRYAINRFGISPSSFGQTLFRFIESSCKKYTLLPSLTSTNIRKLKTRIEALSRRSRNLPVFRFKGTFIVIAFVLFMITVGAPLVGQQFPAEKMMINPIRKGMIFIDYGVTTHPVTKKIYNNRGIDMAAPLGSIIVAPAPGKVIEKGHDYIRGHYLVLLNHDNITTFYCYLGKVLVNPGDNVWTGNTIATVGSSGLASGPIVHFEVQKNGISINPHNVIKF